MRNKKAKIGKHYAFIGLKKYIISPLVVVVLTNMSHGHVSAHCTYLMQNNELEKRRLALH